MMMHIHLLAVVNMPNIITISFLHIMLANVVRIHYLCIQ